MKLLILIFTVCALTACLPGVRSEPTYHDTRPNDFVNANYTAVEKLMVGLNRPLSKSAPLLVTTLVNIDSLEESSRLGRTISEHIQTKLSHLGFAVIEVKMRGDLKMKPDQGELLLSRELKEISQTAKAQAVVVGTYSQAKETLYINLKLVAPDNVVISAYGYTLPLDSNVSSLLGTNEKAKTTGKVNRTPSTDW